MTWFKVDDSFHSHPKTAAVSLAAVGLWTVAGAWSGDHLTDGFVPDHMIPLLARGSTQLADELVVAGLWKRTRKGYQFHQWNERNPEATDVKALREKRAQAGRAGGLASGKTRSKNEANGSPNAWPVLEPPTRPDPTRKEGLAPAREPPSRCPQHVNNPNPPPCGPCAEARRNNDRWHVDRRRRQDTAAKCRQHRGELAHNCRICAAERKAAT